jgi:hypothetical protein
MTYAIMDGIEILLKGPGSGYLRAGHMRFEEFNEKPFAFICFNQFLAPFESFPCKPVPPVCQDYISLQHPVTVKPAFPAHLSLAAHSTHIVFLFLILCRINRLK